MGVTIGKNIVADTSGLDNLVKELKETHRSKMPNTVRFTLSDLAVDAKTRTIPETFLKESDFIIRKPQIVKAFTSYKKAVGYEISTMCSIAGFNDDLGKSKGTKTMIDNMKEQDEGGSIKNPVSPLNPARTGGNKLKTIQSKFWMKNLKLSARVVIGEPQEFIKAVYKAVKNGEKALLYGNIIYQPISFGHIDKFHLKMKLKPLYKINHNRRKQLKKRFFMKSAGEHSATMKLNELFEKNAIKQLSKFK